MNGFVRLSMIVLALAVIVAVAYALLTMPDNRSATDKVGDAIHALPQGPDQAARQLENRTPGQKIGDAIRDAGDKVKDNTAQ